MHQGKKKKKSLVGGAYLDVLAVTLAIQFGTVLHSAKWYWLLCVFPVWGGWVLYGMWYGGGKKSGSGGTSATATDGMSSGNDERRQKRAEKRRQKWS